MAVEIVGRDDEVAALHAFLDGAGPGDGAGPAGLVLEGDAGIGKSTLWLAGVEAAEERGLRVLSARPAEAEQGLAHAALGDLLGACARRGAAGALGSAAAGARGGAPARRRRRRARRSSCAGGSRAQRRRGARGTGIDRDRDRRRSVARRLVGRRVVVRSAAARPRAGESSPCSSRRSDLRARACPPQRYRAAACRPAQPGRDRGSRPRPARPDVPATRRCFACTKSRAATPSTPWSSPGRSTWQPLPCTPRSRCPCRSRSSTSSATGSALCPRRRGRRCSSSPSSAHLRRSWSRPPGSPRRRSLRPSRRGCSRSRTGRSGSSIRCSRRV